MRANQVDADRYQDEIPVCAQDGRLSRNMHAKASPGLAESEDKTTR
jgi:hypothetical protein